MNTPTAVTQVPSAVDLELAAMIDSVLADYRTTAAPAVADERRCCDRDLWQQLDTLSQPHKLEWIWVKGHAGHPENERADALANRGIDELNDRDAA